MRILLAPIVTLFISSQIPVINTAFGTADIIDEAPEDEALSITVEQSDAILDSGECYSTGELVRPERVFVKTGSLTTFALVWLPEDWDSIPAEERRAIFHLHGHCGQGAMHFHTWQELAEERGIAVIAPQVWLDGDAPPPGYNLHPDGGFHLDVYLDTYPMITLLADEYGISSILIHGFSMSACSAVILTYLDLTQADLIDLTVVNAGHISPTHPFRRAIVGSDDESVFEGERFVFLLEDLPGRHGVYEGQLNTRDWVESFGGEVLHTEVAETGRHGVLLNSPSYAGLREDIVEIFTQY